MAVAHGPILILAIWSLLVQIIQCTPGTPFPPCMDVNQKCALGCKEVPITVFSHAERYSSKNVFCFNNDSPAVAMRSNYRLMGCPTTYFNSLQNTSGICSIITEDNRTDLLLTTNELVTGLHSFDCLFDESPTGMVSSSAIVVNAHAPYRDFSVNGVLQDHNNITNITLQVGDDLSVVARAVGNVSVITADHDGSKFTCVTGFACNKHTHDVSNRYLNCFLSSPAQLSDSGKTLTISVNNMELKRFVITVIQRLPEPLISSPPDTEAEPTSTTPNITATTTSSTGKEADSDDNLSNPPIWVYITIVLIVIALIMIVLIAIIVYVCTNGPPQGVHGGTQNEEGKKQNDNEISDNCVEKEVFDTFYAKLVKILPVVDNIYNMLVPEGILDPGDIEEISHMPRSEQKASIVLQKISSSLQASKTDSFNRLLKVMDTSLNNDVKDLVNDMRRALLMAVFSLFCPEQLCDEITRHGYYMIKKVPTLSGNMLRTSLDRGIPLIICSSEYELSREVPELLRTPTIPDNWNILYLHQNDDGNNLQWNERVEVIRIDLNNGRPVVDWLCTKLPRRSSTSVDGRQQDTYL